jgi:hypothetical protein
VDGPRPSLRRSPYRKGWVGDGCSVSRPAEVHAGGHAYAGLLNEFEGIHANDGRLVSFLLLCVLGLGMMNGMERSRGKRTTLWLGAMGSVVLVMAGLLLRDSIREAWHLEGLQYGDEARKARAIEALRELRSRRAVSALLGLVDGDDSLGPSAATAIAWIGDEGGVSKVKELLRKKSPTFRRKTVGRLCEHTPGSVEVFDLLFDIAMSGSGGEEDVVLWQAIEGMRGCGRDCIPPFIEALRAEDPKAATRAARVLSSFGPKAEAAIPALIEILAREEATYEASAALGYIGKAAVPKLIQALENPDPRVRWGAARALGWMKGAAAGASRRLAAAVRDPDREVREQAVEALRSIGPAAAEAVPDPVAPSLPSPIASSVSSWTCSITDTGGRTGRPVRPRSAPPRRRGKGPREAAHPGRTTR